ncbi:MAG: DUF6519 domain-containing protein, partial [Bacteroidia bacterium]
MAGDFSRVRHHPFHDWAAVELKQGAVLLDADFNELVATVDRRLRALASDVLGRATVSQTTPEAFQLSVVAGVLQLGRGRLYVDGLLAENHGAGAAAFDPLLAEPAFAGPLPITAQPYMPVPLQPPGGGRCLVYLDVWEREVTALEDPSLLENAVGVDTSTRLQTVWQARLLSEGVDGASACDSSLGAWDALTAPSSGRLSSGTFDVPPSVDPCELPPTGGYRGLENQLYRVEIHDPGPVGDGGATFKWSRENASIGANVVNVISATELELDSLGRDEVLGIAEGDWVEVLDDPREFSLAAGEMRRVQSADPATRRITLSAALPAAMLPGSFPDAAFAGPRHLRVKRWDQRGRVFRTGSQVPVQDLDAAGSGGVINVPGPGTTLLLENGVTVSFSTTGAPGFRAGDFWVFAARTADASVEELVAAPPRGVHHHYTRLGFWDVASGVVTDCRTPWPPAGGGDCVCSACVTPESHASGQLTIQAAVDRVRDQGGTVCLHAGAYPLREPVRIAGATSLAIRGAGPATVVSAEGSAFVVDGSAAIAIEKLAVVSIGKASAVVLNNAAGVRLSELAIVVLGGNDGTGAGIALSGLTAGVMVRENFIVARDGVRAEAAARQTAVLTAALTLRDNVLWCQRRGIALEGQVGHLLGHRIENNEVLGCRESGITALGVALPGAALRVVGNTLNVNGSGIESGVDGSWIEGNKLQATRQGDRAPTGSAITLATGLDAGGSDQAQVLANQIAGFTDSAILISAPVRDLVCKLNIIEGCGSGIVMSDEGEAGAVSIENNHLRDIRGTGASARAGLAVAIAIARTGTATVAGNDLRRIAMTAGNVRLFAGVMTSGVERVRIQGNEIAEIGPTADFGGVAAGILIGAPYLEAEVVHNRVERDAVAQSAAGESAWAALVITDTDLAVATGEIAAPPPAPAGTTTGTVGSVASIASINTAANAAASAAANATSSAAALSTVRVGTTTTLKLDDRRTLLITGARASVSTAGLDFAVAEAAAVRGGGASVLGNTFFARGRVSAVQVTARTETLFSDNRCTLQGPRGVPAVRLASPVVVLNANRVRGGG